MQHTTGSSCECKLGRKRKKTYKCWEGGEEEKKEEIKTDDMYIQKLIFFS